MNKVYVARSSERLSVSKMSGGNFLKLGGTAIDSSLRLIRRDFYFAQIFGTGFVLENIATKEPEFILLKFRVQGWVGNVATREFWHILDNFSDVGFGPENIATTEYKFYFAQFFERAIGEKL